MGGYAALRVMKRLCLAALSGCCLACCSSTDLAFADGRLGRYATLSDRWLSNLLVLLSVLTLASALIDGAPPPPCELSDCLMLLFSTTRLLHALILTCAVSVDVPLCRFLSC